MATFENVEKLRQRASVSYEEAKEALDLNGDDLLDAMIWLENNGKVSPPAGGGECYTTGAASEATPAPEPEEGAKHGESFGDVMKRFLRFCGRLLNKGNANSFEVWRHGNMAFCMPVTVLVLLLVFFFWFTIPLAVVGLFFGFGYHFSGPDFKRGAVFNKAMEDAAKAAESLKSEFKSVESAPTEDQAGSEK
jgi:hypothetical protein